MSQSISIVMPVYDGVTQLDFTGPHQFLSRTPDLDGGKELLGNDLAAGEAEKLTSGFHSYQRLIDPVNLGYFAGFDEGLPMLRGPRLTNAIRRVHSVINRVVGSHLGGQSNSPSMIELLMRRQAKSPELRLDVVALRV